MANLEPQPHSTVNYPSPKLSLPVKLAYGAGDFGAGLTSQFLAFFLLSFLIYVAGMNPKVAGSVLAIGKIWDAVNDPLVGMLSESHQNPLGSPLSLDVLNRDSLWPLLLPDLDDALCCGR